MTTETPPSDIGCDSRPTSHSATPPPSGGPIAIRDPQRQRLVRREAGAPRHLAGPAGEPGDRVHRSVRLRQVDAAALPEPDERSDRRRPHRGRLPRRWTRTSTRRRPTSSMCGAASAWCSRSRTRWRSRSTRTSSTACGSPASRQGDARRGVRAVAARRGAVGRSQGSARHERTVALGRPAAAPVHRARDRDRAGDRPDGRAVLGARSDRDAEDRGADSGTEVATTRS